MTTTLQQRATSPDEIVAAADALRPALTSRAPEVEAARRVPDDLLAELVSAGCFRVLLPRSHGGAGAGLPTAMRVYETLSRSDPAVGWTVMIGSGVWSDLVRLPRATFDELYRDGPDVLIAGVFSPSGVAVAVEDGYRVTGRWAFASGCRHSTWLYGNCIEEVDGAPHLRTALFAADEVHIEDTWHVLGLRGTGSHHFSVDDVVVPAARTSATLDDEPGIDDPIVRVPPPALIALGISAVAIGTGQGAIDDITAVAASKTPLLGATTLAGNPTFQHHLATADTELRAARALAYQCADELWSTACAGEELTLEQRARIRATAVWVVARASAVVTTAYQAGGGSALYDDSPLQRRLRDISAVTQHFLVRPDTMVTAGALLAGGSLDVPVF